MGEALACCNSALDKAGAEGKLEVVCPDCGRKWFHAFHVQDLTWWASEDSDEPRT